METIARDGRKIVIEVREGETEQQALGRAISSFRVRDTGTCQAAHPTESGLLCGKPVTGYRGKRYCSRTCAIRMQRADLVARGYRRTRTGWIDPEGKPVPPGRPGRKPKAGR